MNKDCLDLLEELRDILDEFVLWETDDYDIFQALDEWVGIKQKEYLDEDS
jgi:hypothetical protein